MKTMHQKSGRLAGLTALAAAALAGACGGGGGGGDTTPPPAGGSIAVAGTAVKGAALAGATVNAKCASGTATATTAAGGGYSVTIASGTLPCVIKVTGTGGEVLHSVVAGSGSSGSFTANVTPLTEMLVARLAGSNPAAFFTAFGAGSSVSAAQVTQASDYVRSAVAGVADLGTADLVGGALAVGDAMDQKIDALMAALSAAGLSLTAVTTAIVANPTAPAVVAAAVAPTAADCAFLRSGRFRIVDVYDVNAELTATINAATLSGTGPDGNPFTMTANGGCSYTMEDADWIDHLAVSPGGLLILQGQSKTTTERNAEIVIPDQTLPVSELAGTWNAVSWSVDGTGTSLPTVHEISFDATGQILSLADCAGLAACVPQAGPFSRFAADAARGGFTEVLTSGQNFTRLFAYNTLAGRKVLVGMTPERQLIIAAPVLAAALPAVGNATGFHQLQVNGNDTIDTMSQDTVTVTAVDSTARTATRIRASDNRVDTLSYDKPRVGLRHRALNSCTLNGAPRNCAETVQIPIQGMGLTVSTSVGTTGAAAFLNISANKPAP